MDGSELKLGNEFQVSSFKEAERRSGTGWRPNPTESERIKVNQGAVFMRHRFHGWARTGNEYPDEPCRDKSNRAHVHPCSQIFTQIHRYSPVWREKFASRQSCLILLNRAYFKSDIQDLKFQKRPMILKKLNRIKPNQTQDFLTTGR